MADIKRPFTLTGDAVEGAEDSAPQNAKEDNTAKKPVEDRDAEVEDKKQMEQ